MSVLPALRAPILLLGLIVPVPELPEHSYRRRHILQQRNSLSFSLNQCDQGGRGTAAFVCGSLIKALTFEKAEESQQTGKKCG
jgi:hypothetical protein